MNTPQEEVESLLRAMKMAAASPKRMNEISDKILTLCTAYMQPAADVPDILPGAKLMPSEYRVLSLLMAKKGLAVSRDAILAASCGKSWDNMPDAKGVDVRICRIRKQIAKVNAPYEIETVHSRGYRLKSKPVAIQQEARAA
jgi:DNA-binding response OmpR family regulator